MFKTIIAFGVLCSAAQAADNPWNELKTKFENTTSIIHVEDLRSAHQGRCFTSSSTDWGAVLTTHPRTIIERRASGPLFPEVSRTEIQVSIVEGQGRFDNGQIVLDNWISKEDYDRYWQEPDVLGFALKNEDEKTLSATGKYVSNPDGRYELNVKIRFNREDGYIYAKWSSIRLGSTSKPSETYCYFWKELF